MKKKIIILSGDPNSINSEIIYKSWKKLRPIIKKKTYFISNYKLLKEQFKKLKLPINMSIVKNNDLDINDCSLKIINIDLKFKNSFKVPKKTASLFIQNSLILAHKIGLRKDIKGIINCAINKTLLSKNKSGVTEFFSSKCKVKKNSEVMLIKNEKLAVCPLTTHIDLKDVAKNISINKIEKKILTINTWYKNKLLKRPRIGILGLNPHNAELSKNSEEMLRIIPAIYKLKKKGINLKGPLVPDSVFIKDYINYDVIVGMYHDQVLSPFKSLYKYNAINVTLGLKYLRASPDHGVAKDLIGKNKADETSLLKCISFINKFGK